jgi:hypothetical protein
MSRKLHFGKHCVVRGCTNRRGEGLFVDQMCKPCHEMITTGGAGTYHGTSFIHTMLKRVDELESKPRE